ncbi:MAG TPA: TlyA family RNA methyltransferase [Syntrophomonadaceae bacterium]|nr:TlyA family RNA methyltransferase [Syntrophomonadaceae bacterium]
MGKDRLDNEIFKRGLAISWKKANAIVIAGKVKVNGVKVDKPGTSVDESVEIYIEPPPKYVSRGGYKLEQAIIDFKIDFNNKTVLDVGASTGGYTDCALQNGAKKVYAVDVGYGQLDWDLRNDNRVMIFERTNIRYLTLEGLGEKVDIVTIDVSFISTSKVFPVVMSLIKDDGVIISLIKPQFEAGKDKVGKKGVIKDSNVHSEVLLNSIKNAELLGMKCVGITYSPITGPQGNIEYFICLQKNGESIGNNEHYVRRTVIAAHKNLGG